MYTSLMTDGTMKPVAERNNRGGAATSTDDVTPSDLEIDDATPSDPEIHMFCSVDDDDRAVDKVGIVIYHPSSWPQAETKKCQTSGSASRLATINATRYSVFRIMTTSDKQLSGSRPCFACSTARQHTVLPQYEKVIRFPSDSYRQ